MASMLPISPRVAQVGFEPVLRPRSPSLSRIARRVASSAASVSPTPTPSTVEQSVVESFGRRRHNINNYVPQLAEQVDNLRESQIVIPLPAPFSRPTMARTVAASPTPNAIAIHEPRGLGFINLGDSSARTTTSSPQQVAVTRAEPPVSHPSQVDSKVAYRSQSLSPLAGASFRLASTRLSALTPPAIDPSPRLPPLAPNYASGVRISHRSPSPGDPEFVRAVPVSERPNMTVESTSVSHVFSVKLEGYAPDEVAISARGSQGLRIVADKWGASWDEQCYLEYDISFAHADARLAGVHAGFRDGVLRVTVPRR